MAKKITKVVKLQVAAGKATPAPPVGPALGQAGVNIMAFVKDFNDRTAKQVGLIIPVEITVFEDRSFTFEADKFYDQKGAQTSGRSIIQDYWSNFYIREIGRAHV